ncbi:MAG: deoxynucleotide monophosphate kinase, partial [Pseudomonadota bacterium]
MTATRPPFVVALTGPAGCGKSTVARILREIAPPVAAVRFAGPLKSMFHTFLTSSGVDPLDAMNMVDGHLKEVPADALGGRTPRHAMQTLGTEWGRNLIDADLWTSAWRRSAVRVLDDGRSVVAEDCRFANEAGLVRGLGGIVVRLTGRDGVDVGDHSSE